MKYSSPSLSVARGRPVRRRRGCLAQGFYVLAVIGALLFIFGALPALGGLIWLVIWNYLIADLTGWQTISYPQAVLLWFVITIALGALSKVRAG